MTIVASIGGFDGPLVGAERLQAELENERVRILDVRGRHASSALPHAKRAEHASSHIPGAVFVDWERDFVAREDPVPIQLADADEFARRAGELGVGDGDVVVTYDDYYGIFASRVAWAFRVHGAAACVLDGGWQTWEAEGRPRTDAVSEPDPALFTPAIRPRLRRSLEDVVAARERGATLVDARPRHLFLGEDGLAGTGHIPGSRCLPYQELVDGATGLWAAPDALTRLARDAGIDPARPPGELIATCGSGVSATVALLALERIGVHADGVYDGSFNEWSADPSRPIEFGATKRPADPGRTGTGR
jgi:thiosulfate/3-mercaptopyruvate sulfurtransferase